MTKMAFLSTAPVGNTIGWFIMNEGSDITMVNPLIENVGAFNYFIPLEDSPENVLVPTASFFAYAGNPGDIEFDRNLSYQESWQSIVKIMGSGTPYHAYSRYAKVYSLVQKYLDNCEEPSPGLATKIEAFYEGLNHVVES